MMTEKLRFYEDLAKHQFEPLRPSEIINSPKKKNIIYSFVSFGQQELVET